MKRMPEVTRAVIWRQVRSKIPCVCATIFIGTLAAVYIIWGQVVTGNPEDVPTISIVTVWSSVDEYHFYMRHNATCQELYDVHCNTTFWGQHRLAVIVPYRGSHNDVVQFAPHLHHYFQLLKIRHKFFFINQVDDYKYNKGALLNLGAVLSRAECDYVALQDIDQLPDNTDFPYSYPGDGAVYIVGPHSSPTDYKDYVMGGLFLVNTHQFIKVNGFSNRFWGKEGADENFKLRLQKHHVELKVEKAWGHFWNDWTLPFRTFDHIYPKSEAVQVVPVGSSPMDNETVTGVSSLSYSIVNITEVEAYHPDQEDSSLAIIFDVQLNCSAPEWEQCVPNKHELVSETTMAPLT